MKFMVVAEIIIYRRLVGYLYLMDWEPKEQLFQTEKSQRLLSDFISSLSVLISANHPIWLEEERENAELAVDLLHHIQYPIKRVTAVANEIHRTGEDLKKLFLLSKSKNQKQQPSLLPTSSVRSLKNHKNNHTLMMSSELAHCFNLLDVILKSFKNEMKLLDELIENSFQLHLHRSPNLSRISCEYDYILSLSKIPSYIVFVTNQFFHCFHLKSFPIIIDAHFSELHHVYMHTSLLWITLYWCFFQLLFLSKSGKHGIMNKIELRIHYYNSLQEGQGLDCFFTINDDDSTNNKLMSSGCISQDNEDKKIKSFRENLRKKQSDILGKLSYKDINCAFQHFLLLFNVVIEKKIAFSSDLPSDEVKDPFDTVSAKGGFIRINEANSFDHCEPASDCQKWNLRIPLSITTSSFFTAKKKISRSTSTSEYSAQYGNHCVVQRNNSLDLTNDSHKVVGISRKLKPLRRGSRSASCKGGSFLVPGSPHSQATYSPGFQGNNRDNEDNEATYRVTHNSPPLQVFLPFPTNVGSLSLDSHDGDPSITTGNRPLAAYLNGLANSIGKPHVLNNSNIPDQSEGSIHNNFPFPTAVPISAGGGDEESSLVLKNRVKGDSSSSKTTINSPINASMKYKPGFSSSCGGRNLSEKEIPVSSSPAFAVWSALKRLFS
jgi:hypothetical protein